MPNKNEKKLRPPIVAVLGHVDHGKTTLLDYIRQSKVADRESGGITQAIGASVVSTKEGKEITFIDTPGHAVFSQMRSSGANVSDVAVLVVASNDSVKPQTKEALKFINDSEVSYVVAATKTDLPTSDLSKVKSDLQTEGVSFDGEGGNVPIIGVSGKTGEGVDKLLETIRLLWEINATKDNGDLQAFVIESVKGKQGVLASIVVKSGTIKVGDVLFAGSNEFKVRGLVGWTGKPVRQVEAGYPAQIIGMSLLPKTGAVITTKQIDYLDNKAFAKKAINVDEGELAVILKAKTQGGLEAISANIPENVVIIDKSAGDVTDSDVFMAKSIGAIIIVFESKSTGSVAKLATAEKVEIKSFDIVYEIFDYLQKRVKQGQTEILGTAEILAEFPFDKRRVAGVKITSGKIEKNHKLIVLRDGEEIGETKIASLKRETKDVGSVIQGQEAGIIFDPYLDFSVGDMIVSFQSLR